MNVRYSFVFLCFSLALISYFGLENKSWGQSDETLYAKTEEAFNALRTGNVDTVQTIKESLNDPRFNTQVRTALESADPKTALPILRDGLLASDLECVAGCVNSLGRLHDAESAERIASLAQDKTKSLTIRCVAYRCLGLLKTDGSLEVLKSGLQDTADLELRSACADGLLEAARSLESAELFRTVREANVSEVVNKIAVQNEIILSKDVELFEQLLKSENKFDFQAACIVMASCSDWGPAFWESIEQTLDQISIHSQNRVIEAMGESGNQAFVPILRARLKKSNIELSTQIVLLGALSELKDPLVFDICFDFLSSQEETLRNAAVNCINNLDSLSEKNIVCLKNVLEGEGISKFLVNSCLKIVASKGDSKLADSVKKATFDSSDLECLTLGVATWANLIEPTPNVVENYIKDYCSKSLVTETFDRGLMTLCRRTPNKRDVISILERTFQDDSVRLARLVGEMGGKDAADYLGELALTAIGSSSETDVDTVDVVTELLGRWNTPDASEALARLALLLPEGKFGKFKTRAIRGYIRIVRQMGELPLEKMQKISLAYRMTENRPKERELLQNLDARFISKFKERSLFNGKDLAGWEEYEPGVFKVEDGSIVGGNFETGVEHNQFLTTVESFKDFYLRLECKIVVGENNHNNDGNAGVQFRSVRIPDNWEMIGYQADMTSDGGYWGCLYDESRRNRMLQVPDPKLQSAIYNPNGWNTYEILAQDGNVRVFLNGIQTVNYTEDDESIPLAGKIGLQIHAGGPARSYYRNIFICDSATDDSN